MTRVSASRMEEEMAATEGAGEWNRGSLTEPPMPPLRWRKVFRGEERQLAVLRRWLTSLFPECPARDDVVAVANELGSNAIRHTASGQGGWFAAEVTWYGTVVRVAVADSGSPNQPVVIDDPAGENGRGLFLVRELSVRTGMTGDHSGRLLWADIAWNAPAAATSVIAQDPYEAVIRDGHAALADRFAGVPTWFGRETLAWWAMADSARLVTAPTSAQLGDLLDRLLGTPALSQDSASADATGEVALSRRHLLAPGRPALGARADSAARPWRSARHDGQGSSRRGAGLLPGRQVPSLFSNSARALPVCQDGSA
jgi:hypothetical protein